MRRVFVFLSLILFFFNCTTSKKEKVVRLPFNDLYSFVPYYWQAQHILAQGTIFEGLLGYEPDESHIGGVKLVPVICESYEVSEDGTVWTFKLRKDKKWSNGDPINAHDFIWSYRYYADPKLLDIPYWASPLQYVKNGWGVKSGAIPIEDLGIKALDDYTIEMTTDKPRYDFHCWMAVGGAMPIHRASVEAMPEDWWKPENLICNGPYTVAKWTQGEGAELVKNQNYVGECGNVDRIVLKYIDNYNQMQLGLQSYQAGELDLAWLLNPGQVKYVKDNPKLLKNYHQTVSDLQFQGYQLTRGFDPLLDDKKIRQAFAYSIDREVLVKKVLVDNGYPAYSYWSDNTEIGKKMNKLEFNPDKAKKLLAEAGYPGGKNFPELKFYVWGASNPVGEFVVEQWKENLGVDVKIENVEANLYWSKYVWGQPREDVSAGFTLINAPMNSFSSLSLQKNALHTYLFFGYPGKVRKKRYLLEFKEKVDVRKIEKGVTLKDWKPILKRYKATLKQIDQILKTEKSELWKKYLTMEPTFQQQFDNLYNEWKKAKDDKEKIKLWQEATYVLIFHGEMPVSEHTDMYENVKESRRLCFEIESLSFEDAIKVTDKVCNIYLDEAYVVPLYFEKVQYIKNPKLKGLNLYKFSWGPLPFNFKYLNLED